jgi:hypothetical protein
MKTLYIHIGTGKTGTSAIQSYLFNNRLKDVKYCQTGLEGELHNILCINFKRHLNRVDEVDILRNKLITEIIQGSEARYLISSEFFPGLTSNEIEQFINPILVAGVNVKIITYLRRQDEFVESWYKQIVKADGELVDIELLKDRLYEAGALDYEKLLSSYEAVVSKDSIIVKAYEKSSFVGGNIITDFLSIFGLQDLCNPTVVNEIVNPSLCREQLYLARIVNKYCNPEQAKIFRTPIPLTGSKYKYLLSPDNREQIIKDFAKTNEWVADRYCGRNELFYERKIDNDWVDIDIFKTAYIDKFVCYFVYKEPIILKTIEAPLVDLLYNLAIQNEKLAPNIALNFINLALLVRPKGVRLRDKIIEYLDIG